MHRYMKEILSISFSSDELMDAVNFILFHHHGNVDTLYKNKMNLGYPVLLTTMSCIEIVAALCFGESKNPHHLDCYFDKYMSLVNKTYGLKFDNFGSSSISKSKSSHNPLADVKPHLTNTGRILRESMRNRIAHSGGSLLEIDARQETACYHLSLRIYDNIYTLFVNAYVLFYDYTKSLNCLHSALEADPEFRHHFQRNVCTMWIKLHRLRKSLSDVLENSKLPVIHHEYPSLLQKLNEILKQ